MIENKNEYINYIKMPQKERTHFVNLKIVSLLKIYKPLIDYLDEPNNKELTKILYKLSENLTYRELSKGLTLKQLGDEDCKFYILLKGKIAELSIRYRKLFLTINEYFLHIIKLHILQEHFLLNEVLSRNKRVYEIPKDPISFLKNLKNFNFEENYSSIKKTITLNEWYVNYDINEYIQLINVKKKKRILKPEHIIIKEPEYAFIIPEYVFSKFLTDGYYIDTLTEPKHIKNLFTYITVKRSKFAILDKNTINSFEYYQSIHSQQKEYLEKLFKELYIFQGINTDFIMNNFSSFFEYKVVKKGDIIIKQDSPHYGIFLIKNGKFQVRTYRTINEVDNLIFILKHSIDNFNNYVSEFQKEEKINKFNFNQNNIVNPVLGSKEFISMLNKSKEFVITTIEKNQIIGFNEFYNYKNGNNLFTVECISDIAEIFFVPKTIVTSLLNSYDLINNKIAIRVEQRAKFFINTLERQKYFFNKETTEIIRQQLTKTANSKGRLFSGLNKSEKNIHIKTIYNKFKLKTQLSEELFVVNRKLIDRMGQVTSYFQSHQNLINNHNKNFRFKSQKNKSTTILNSTLNNLNNSLRLKSSYLRNITNKKGEKKCLSPYLKKKP